MMKSDIHEPEESHAPCPYCHVPMLPDLAYCPHCGGRIESPEPQEDFSEFFENSLVRATSLRLVGITSGILGLLLFFAPGFNPAARALLGGEMMLLGALCIYFVQKEYRCPRCGAPVDLQDAFSDDRIVLCHDCYARLR